jgi:hypothetical protein
MTTIWDLLQDLACRDAAPVPVVVEGVQILSGRLPRHAAAAA